MNTTARLQKYQNAVMTMQLQASGQISTRESVLKRLRELEGRKNAPVIISVPLGAEGEDDND